MTDTQYERAQQQLVGVQRDVFDAVRRHVHDAQAGAAARAGAARWVHGGRVGGWVRGGGWVAQRRALRPCAARVGLPRAPAPCCPAAFCAGHTRAAGHPRSPPCCRSVLAARLLRRHPCACLSPVARAPASPFLLPCCTSCSCAPATLAAPRCTACSACPWRTRTRAPLLAPSPTARSRPAPAAAAGQPGWPALPHHRRDQHGVSRHAGARAPAPARGHGLAAGVWRGLPHLCGGLLPAPARGSRPGGTVCLPGVRA